MAQNELPESANSAEHGVTMTFLRDGQYVTRVTIDGDPNAAEFFVPFHWHEKHDEVIRVEKGQFKIAMGSSNYKVYTAEDGDVVIPKGTSHSLMGVKGVPTVFLERTDPMDGNKEMFFRNIFATGGLSGGFLSVMQVCYYGDNMPTFPFHIRWLEKAFVTVFGYWVAPLFGCKLKYEDLKKRR